MKRVKAKGFTLIELIIVMAIFSVIMFGAMQLMQPSRALFNRGYDSESVTAAEKNIKNYLESNLRYVQYIKITNEALPPPTLSEAQRMLIMTNKVRSFINEHYNGKIDETGAPATGKIYVMYIDNNRGGRIRTMEFDYTAGNLNPDEAALSPAAWDADSLIKNYAPKCTFVQEVTSAINAAMYDEYNFQISMGVTKPVISDEALAFNSEVSSTTGEIVSLPADKVKDTEKQKMYSIQRDAEYYNQYTDGVAVTTDLMEFGRKNCTFTINAYKLRDGIAQKDGVTYFENVYPMTASVSMINVGREDEIGGQSFLHHNWYEATDKDDSTKKFWILERNDSTTIPEHKGTDDRTLTDQSLFKWYSVRQDNAHSHLSLSDKPFDLCDELKNHPENQAMVKDIMMIYTYPEE